MMDERVVPPNVISNSCSSNGLLLNHCYIPEELLVYTLKFLDAEELLKYRSVCHYWKEIIDNYVWKEKVMYGKYSSLSTLTELEISRLQLPWIFYYVVCTYDPFNKNLIKNHCGQEGAEHWTILRGRFGRNDSGWNVEPVPIGSDMLPSGCNDFDGYSSCFVTSCDECKMEQFIDLENYGLYGSIMDKYQPIIVASEWCAGRYDCGCKYTLKVALLDEDGVVISKKEATQVVQQWDGNEWNKVEIIFENYGSNVRHIVFHHEGQDTIGWRGHYGSKMSGAVLKVLLPKHIIESESFEL